MNVYVIKEITFMGENILPDFDERGCLPEGIYNPTIKEFKERFVIVSPRRQELFGKYKQFTKLCNDAKGIEEHYLDGSYVTDKEKPGDIDLLITFNDHVYDTDESYNNYFEITHNQAKIKEDYEIHLFFSKNSDDLEPLEIQQHWQREKNKVLGWWSRYYTDRENNIIDDEKKGFVLFKEQELRQIEDW